MLRAGRALRWRYSNTPGMPNRTASPLPHQGRRSRLASLLAAAALGIDHEHGRKARAMSSSRGLADDLCAARYARRGLAASRVVLKALERLRGDPFEIPGRTHNVRRLDAPAPVVVNPYLPVIDRPEAVARQRRFRLFAHPRNLPLRDRERQRLYATAKPSKTGGSGMTQ